MPCHFIEKQLANTPFCQHIISPTRLLALHHMAKKLLGWGMVGLKYILTSTSLG
jgi:hypothetical protein